MGRLFIPAGCRYAFFDRASLAKNEEEHSQHEWTYGCNRELHVGWLNKVYYDKDWKKVVFAEPLKTIEICPCDKTCAGHADMGGALHPTPSSLLSARAR